jgi:hypothetical protein
MKFSIGFETTFLPHFVTTLLLCGYCCMLNKREKKKETTYQTKVFVCCKNADFYNKVFLKPKEWNDRLNEEGNVEIIFSSSIFSASLSLSKKFCFILFFKAEFFYR